jgi:PAS domain S-box-containing protein
MSDAARETLDRRVLILAPTGRDAELSQLLLKRAGIFSAICPDAESLCRQAEAHAGCILLTEEAITADSHQVLSDLLAKQPSWSDLPVVLLTMQGADSVIADTALSKWRNVTLLERPVRAVTLISTLRGALRARDRQYELRDHFEAQALLAAIVMSSDDAIISKTLEGKVLTWNVGAERLFGYTADEAIGQPITIIVPPDRLDEERTILQRLTEGERIDHFETVRISKAGRRIDISLTISPIRNASDRIIGASKVARDISVQRQAEQALRDADRRKDEFLATLAHELRNPLAPICNSLHILRRIGKSDPGTEQHVLEMMERQVNHMVRLVDDLMEVSRITRGMIELRKERVELDAVLRSALETSQPLIQAAGHHIAIAIPTASMMLEADPIRLAQVFSNLLNNAAKYTPEGGHIWITAHREENTVSVSVRDNGVGIAAEMLPRVFEIFTQVGVRPYRRSQEGLGIGLTIVRSLVQLQGGTVAVTSEGLGKGSEFIVSLPLAKEFAVDEQGPESRQSSRLQFRILVVDDNYDSADSMSMMLRSLGAEVQVAHSGPAALRELETFRPHIALLDIGMPGMDGYELARRIREQSAFRDLVLIALTGWGQEEDRRRSFAAGFDHHLIKPMDIDTLQEVIVSVGRRE